MPRTKMMLSALALLAGGMFLTEVAHAGGRPLPAQESAGSKIVAQGEQDARELMSGASLIREMTGGETHAYRIRLSSGQYFHVVVDQQGIDVVVLLFGPNGQMVAGMDTLTDYYGPEMLSAVADVSGIYRLEVRTFASKASRGRYELRVAELREATPQDGTRIAAERALAEGTFLYGQETEESRRRAIKRYEEALPFWRTLADRQGEAYTLSGLGFVYASLGEYQNAIEYYNQALPLLRITGTGHLEAYTLNGLGLVYWWLGDYEKARECHQQALTLSRSLGNYRDEARALDGLGLIHLSSGEYQKAREYNEQALTVRRTVDDQLGEGYTLNGLGLDYWKLGQYQKALEYCGEALRLLRARGDRQWEAHTLTNLGVIYYSAGEHQKAYDSLNEALAIHQALGNRQGQAVALYWIGRNEIGRGNLIQARTQVEAALAIIESVRTKVASQRLRTSYLATNRDFYECYIDVLMRMHGREPAKGYDAAALEASERARARGLLETLTEAHADIRQGVDPALLERERRLQQQLNDKERVRMQLLGGKHTEEQAAAMEKGVEDLIAQYQDVLAQIRATSPRYAALTQPVPLSLKEIQQQVLDDDTLLLEYSLGEERSYLWAVTPASINSFVLPKRTEIETAARRVYELLTTSHQREPKRQAELAAAGFGRMVLGPVRKLLGRKRLLIVSDGALQYVPFSALLLPEDENGGIKNDRENTGRSFHPSSLTSQPLMVEHEIVSLPSASVLAVLRRETAGRQPAANTVAVLADAVFRGDDPRVQQNVRAKAVKETGGPSDRSGDERTAKDDLTRSATESGLTGFERLRFTRQEAEAIVAQADGGKSLKALDFAASRATVMTGGLDRYRMVHFATHGILNNQHPELSGVVLSLVDEQGRPQDGFLRAHDIYNLKLRADLVVLSACQTALGKEIKGEGLVGLTRGFMYAGAARVVASLWDVKDEATAELMKRFYRGMLREGLRPAAALRAAQVSMWKEKRWEAPYYWAGFVLQGEWK